MSNAATIKSRGNPLWRLSKNFQYAADRLIPDSFVFCLILTFLVFVLSIIFTGTSPLKMVNFWFDGFWTQATFAFQMTLMVVTCATTAKSRQVAKAMDALAKLVRTPAAAMVLLMVFGYVSSFLNWAFCTIVTPILAMRLAKNIKGLHFPMMVAAGYSTMVLGQCLGPSASVYALLATKGHFLEDKLGIMTQAVTTYNPMNVVLWIILAAITIILSVFTRPPKDEVVEFTNVLDEIPEDIVEAKDSIADRLNGSRICMWLIGIAGLVVIVYSFITKGFLGSLSVNFIIFLFTIANCFLYNSPRKFIKAYRENIFLATDVMIQFPFYGGIAQMMSSSGFAAVVVSGIVSISSARSIPVWSYISACLVNMFIPSQGGQWIVQGPLLVDATQQLGGSLPNVINAFVYGDEATNLLQPLYLIPALAVVNMKLKEVWGYCAYLCLFWFILTCLGLYFIPFFV
jgi:short-chain fatty acids transporter